jgi:hypothetical protein
MLEELCQKRAIPDIEFFINTNHICSTDLGWNPLFVQVGRNYNIEYNKKIIYNQTPFTYTISVKRSFNIIFNNLVLFEIFR